MQALIIKALFQLGKLSTVIMSKLCFSYDLGLRKKRFISLLFVYNMLLHFFKIYKSQLWHNFKWTSVNFEEMKQHVVYKWREITHFNSKKKSYFPLYEFNVLSIYTFTKCMLRLWRINCMIILCWHSVDIEFCLNPYYYYLIV